MVVTMKSSALFSCLLGAAASPSAHGWWSKVAFSTKAPKVSGHSIASFFDEHDSTFLFGGLTGAAGSPCTDETWEYSNKNNAWTLLETKKKKPRVRMYAASAAVQKNNKMVLFGGWDPGAPGSGGEFLNDIWEFDCVTKEWHEMDIQLPYPVSRHTACTIAGMDTSSDDSSLIIIHTYQGILVYKDGALEEQETSGDAPEGLSMCAVAPLNKSQMVLFGGSTRTQQLSQDAYVLDTTTWKWTKLEVGDHDSCPPTLASPCAAQVSENQVIVFGGASIGPTGYEGGMGLVPQNDAWLLKISTEDHGKKAHWTKVVISTEQDDEHDQEAEKIDNKPEGRVAATICPIGPSSFLLQGGYDPLTKTTFDEPWVLDL